MQYRDIPNSQVLNAANQYESAAKVLHENDFFVPVVNCRTIAVELYLKSLCSEIEFTPEPEGGNILNAKPSRGHEFIEIFEKIADKDKHDLEEQFRHLSPDETFKDRLRRFPKILEVSRYPYERTAGTRLKIDEYPISKLMELSEFLCRYMTTFEHRGEILRE